MLRANLLSCLSHVHLFDNLVDCSPPGSSLHGILQARILEWVSHSPLQEIFLTQGSNPCLLGLPHWRQILYCWATRGAHIMLHLAPKHTLYPHSISLCRYSGHASHQTLLRIYTPASGAKRLNSTVSYFQASVGGEIYNQNSHNWFIWSSQLHLRLLWWPLLKSRVDPVFCFLSALLHMRFLLQWWFMQDAQSRCTSLSSLPPSLATSPPHRPLLPRSLFLQKGAFTPFILFSPPSNAGHQKSRLPE